MTTLPTIMSAAGLVPQTPSNLRSQLLSSVAATNPGYTANLPGALIEDISSTDVGAIVLMDQARVETINSVTPNGANDFLLAQIGDELGINSDVISNTSVNVVFTGPPGFVIPIGFVVGDGTYSYVVQDGGVIQESNQSMPLYCLAAASGAWDVPPGSVTTISSTLPNNVVVTCSNSSAGIPGNTVETSTDFRDRVMQGQRASAQGMPSFVRTLLRNVPGVQNRLISIQQLDSGGWKMIVGGGDIYAVAYAIFRGLLDISQLQPSIISVLNITTGANAVVTTDLNHGFNVGNTAYVNGIKSGMTGINGVPLTITNILDDKNFQTNVNTGVFGAYIDGGVVTPNNRNNNPKLFDYPDTYDVKFISPPSQGVAITVNWSTNLPGYVNIGAVEQLARPALVNYVNSISVARPMNLYDLQKAFRAAVKSIVPEDEITNLSFQVSLNGVGAAFTGGILDGDPESYFLTASDGSEITVNNI